MSKSNSNQKPCCCGEPQATGCTDQESESKSLFDQGAASACCDPASSGKTGKVKNMAFWLAVAAALAVAVYALATK